MSGGLIFEWTQEDNNYGIVDAYHNGTVHLRGDYDALMQQYSGLNITLIENHNNTATSLKPPKCSAGLIGDNGVSKDFDLPSVPDGVADLISNGLPSANAGSIVPVTKTKVDLPVYATSGGEISGLAISPADGSNKPGKNGGLTTGEPSAVPSGNGGGNGSDNGASQTGSGGSSPTGSSEGASATDSSSAAGKAVVANGAALGAVLGLALFAL